MAAARRQPGDDAGDPRGQPGVRRRAPAHRPGLAARARRTASRSRSAGFRITALAVAHEQLDTDELGRHHHLGYLVARRAVSCCSTPATPCRTRAWPTSCSGSPAAGRSTSPCCRSTAGCPSGGCRATSGATRRRTFAHAVGARLVVPMHYEMFAFNTETPELFVATAEQLGQPYRVLRCGELLDLDPNS